MGQMKYHSDDPRLPPKEKIDAYTIGEIKKMLGIESRSTVYNIYRRYNLDLIRVDGMTLVVKESFDNWFRSQKIYPKKKKRKKGGK
ncbi:MAG: helix-turn-helix domain-containing protein, partial [Parasporobacterium sp.]|nr:helix-turn-helix domain-containing protein [Parasporobacterium sp.]